MVKTVEIQQLHVVEKIVEIPQIQMDQGRQTSDSLGTAPVRPAAQVEIVEAVEIGAPLPAESGSPMFVKATVLEVPVVVEHVHVTPAPTVVQAVPVTTSTVAPTVFPAPVPIATAQIATATLLKTFQLCNRVCFSCAAEFVTPSANCTENGDSTGPTR